MQDIKSKAIQQLTASLPFLPQVPEVRLNFVACFALTLAEHACVAASGAASSQASEASPFLQEQEVKQSMSEAQLCS